MFDKHGPWTRGDVFVVGYRATPISLELHLPDDEAIAKAIASGKIPGETQGADSSSPRNRITGGPHPELLDRTDLFSTAVRFRRIEPKSP